MDMKKILQAIDGASTKPVEGSNDMKKFLSVVTEGANPHKVTLPVQMAMQHYNQPQVEQPKTIKEVKKSAMSNMLYQYYTAAEQELEEAQDTKKEIISEQARRIAERILAKESRLDELSKETLQSYKSKAEEQLTKLESEDVIERRKKGIETAEKKIAAKESHDPAEYDQEGEMARQDLSTAEDAAEELRSILTSDENLPEWVQAKITKAVDYLDTARDYMKSVDESRYGSRDAYQRDYDSSQTGFGRQHRDIDDEANLMYVYRDGRVKQRMISNHEERSAHQEGFRGTKEEALKLHGIIRSKYDPKKWVQKQGSQWVQVHPFGDPTAVEESKKKTLKNSNPCWKGYHPVGTKQKNGRTVPNCVPKE